MEQNTTEWLNYRREGIGASDASIIMGKSKYKTIQELWEEKTGLVEPDNKTNFIQKKGHDLEIKARYFIELETGKD